MRIRITTLAVACLAALSACQTLADIASLIPTPTPQQQCETGGGRWRTITKYDANGIPTYSGECISK